MKTVTVNVLEPVYREFQRFAKRADRTTAELIREAMEEYRRKHVQRTTTLRDLRPFSAGGPIKAVAPDEDLLGEMLDDLRD